MRAWQPWKWLGAILEVAWCDKVKNKGPMHRRIRRQTVLALTMLLMAHTPGASLASENLCQPKSITTRILDSPSPNSIHPNWQGKNYIGLSWNLVRYGEETKNGVRYLKGKLLSPFRPKAGYSINEYYNGRGDIVWGVLSEWDCS